MNQSSIDGRRYSCRASVAMAAQSAGAGFDEEAARRGWKDLTPVQDRGVLKRVQRPGADAPPSRREVDLDAYVGRVFLGGSGGSLGGVFDTTRDVVDGVHVGGTDDPHVFALRRGDSSVPRGFDVAVASMKRGEVAEFVFSPMYGYSPRKRPARLPEGSSMFFEIELLDWGEALPKLPSRAERAARERMREAQEREEAEQEPSDDERLAKSSLFKAEGNAAVAAGNFAEAKKQYDTAFATIFVHPKVWESGKLPKEVVDKYNAMRKPLHLNRALCNLKLNDTKGAVFDCDKALEIEPDNVKALFRRSQARMMQVKQMMDKDGTGEYWDPDRALAVAELIKADLDQGMAVDSGNKALRQANAEYLKTNATLRKLARQYERERDNLFRSRMKGGLLKSTTSKAASAPSGEGASEDSAGESASDVDSDELPDLG